jgi:hypothetical protein
MLCIAFDTPVDSKEQNGYVMIVFRRGRHQRKSNPKTKLSLNIHHFASTKRHHTMPSTRGSTK